MYVDITTDRDIVTSNKYRTQVTCCAKEQSIYEEDNGHGPRFPDLPSNCVFQDCAKQEVWTSLRLS